MGSWACLQPRGKPGPHLLQEAGLWIAAGCGRCSLRLAGLRATLDGLRKKADPHTQFLGAFWNYLTLMRNLRPAANQGWEQSSLVLTVDLGPT